MKVLCLTDRQDRPETELFLRLANLVDDLSVMCNPDGRHYDLVRHAAIRTMPLQLKGRRDREGIQSIRTELYAGDYDIAHAFNSRALSSLIRAARHHRTKVLGYRGVTTGVSYLKPESWGTFLSPRLDGVFCVSEAVRQALVSTRFLWLRFPPEKAQTIYKGHDPAWYQIQPISKEELGIPDDAKAICCIARNSSKKGALTLLDAFENLPEDLHVHLVFVGGIADNKRVRVRASRSRQRNRILFTGYRPDAVAIIRSVDVLVSASESGEGLPRVVLEAMCVRTPVVATDTGGTREVVTDAETGLLVPPRNAAALSGAILRTIQDPAHSVRRATAAYERITRVFNPKHTAEEVVKWYAQIADDRETK